MISDFDRIDERTKTLLGGLVRHRLSRGPPWGPSGHCARMSDSGHELPFAVTRNRVWNAAISRHSALSVGNAPVNGPSPRGR